MFGYFPGTVWVSYYCKLDNKVETIEGSKTPSPICCGQVMTAFMVSSGEPKIAEVQRSVVMTSVST